ncbi:MAG: SRPBCC family protein [Chloroflexota bacterium]
MASATFEHRYFINISPSKVYEYLSKPENYVGLSPLVTEVSVPESSSNPDGQTVIHYEAVETFNFLGFIHYPNRIKVAMTLTQPDRQMINLVESIPNVRVKFVFDFQAEGSGTWIHESVTAHMPLPLRSFVVSQAKAVQQARGEILKERLEGS